MSPFSSPENQDSNIDDATNDSVLMRMVYISKRSGGYSDEDVLEMVMRAVERNRELSVTGCLWFGDEYFLQIIEGERTVIHDLYGRIEANPMHHEVSIISYQLVNRRVFGPWSMAYVKEEDEGTAISDIISDFFSKQHSANNSESSDRVRSVMTQLRDQISV